MKKILARILCCLIVLISPKFTNAFDMNPIDVDCWGKSYLCNFTKSSEKLKFPVHETITLIAYDCYEQPDSCAGGVANTSAEEFKKTGRLRDLELGSEWNDDPDSLLRQSVTRAKQWYALFNDAKFQAECKKIQDTKCNNIEIVKNPMLLYRSHFGDLQFIHSMASNDDEEAIETKIMMMAWAEFTYKIFTSHQNIDDLDISNFPEISEIINKPGWTVGALFNPVPGGEWKTSLNPFKFGHYESNGKPREINRNDDISVKYIALGSLLHMVQDSYSESHTHREPDCNPLLRSKGKIINYRNYIGQNSDDHGIADVYPEWLKNGKLPKDNAVWASAQLINFAFKREPWDKVKVFLDTVIFPLDDTQAKPKPGSKDCFEGK